MKAILLSLLFSSLFWFVYYFGFVDTSNQSANIIGHLIETVGRQKQAWTKLEQIIETFGVALSYECLYSPGCVDEASDRITTLRAEIDKESAEINNLWSENVIGRDFDEYYASLGEKDQMKLFDLMDIYFPEETGELETTNLLL